jgi:hypothetical protein
MGHAAPWNADILARMWMLFHRNAKTRPVRGGETFVETCPECGKRATFDEVEITEKFGVFFVDLVGDKERAFRCRACGETFDLKDRGETAAPPAAKPAVDVKAELARAEARRALEEKQRSEAAAAKAVRIDDELAELKKRLGK